MKLNRLTLKDKKLFNRFFSLTRHELSVYAFENIYIWKGLFDIRWLVTEDSLCVFFKDKIGCFAYLVSLGKRKVSDTLNKVFGVMDGFNKNKEISRIENIEQKDARFFEDLGFDVKAKFSDYVCERNDLANISGNKFKSKRAGFNYFTKHYKYEYLPFSLRYKNECLKLYNRWKEERKTNNQEPIYRGMLEDSLISLKVLLDDYEALNLCGRLVKIDKTLKGLTFGFKLNPDTFCILYEITDISVKGLAQFIFSRFSQELKDYKYINIMDDSGLENLKKLKLSYHPVKLITSYIAKRKNG